MPLGWWDNSNIIVRDTNDNLILYDVPSGKTTDFLSAARLTKFLEEMQIWDERPGAVSLLCDWNGRENEFYLADTEKRLQAGTSFLIKIERPGAALKLLNREFKFEWQGELDRAGTRYVYSGRLPGQGISGVYLRDVTAKTNRMLVIPDNDTAFTHPRLFRDSLIYLKSNMLWRIDLNGSNRTRLFPPR